MGRGRHGGRSGWVEFGRYLVRSRSRSSRPLKHEVVRPCPPGPPVFSNYPISVVIQLESVAKISNLQYIEVLQICNPMVTQYIEVLQSYGNLH